MFRILFFTLAIPAFLAQDPSTTSSPAGRSPIPSLPTDSTITGGLHEYKKVIQGDLEDLDENPADFRVYIEELPSNRPVSYWHDIPLFFSQPDKIYNMIVEIPRGDSQKTMLNISEEMTPITALLTSEGRPQHEYVDYIHNLGKLPQTYVAKTVDEKSKLPGNGMPLDVLEISDRTHRIGDIVPVKILGLLGVDHNGKIDYKVVAFDVRANFANVINSLDDVERHFPDLLAATRGYFRFYRFPDFVNTILFGGVYQTAGFTHDLIAEKHQEWLKLIQSEEAPKGVSITSFQPQAAHKADEKVWHALIDHIPHDHHVEETKPEEAKPEVIKPEETKIDETKPETQEKPQTEEKIPEGDKK